MYRCITAGLLAAALAAPAAAQLQRNFPQNALRGAIVLTDPPDITLNGNAARLAPGARIRGKTNMIELTGGLVGALIGSGIPEETAKGYETGLNAGGIVLGFQPKTQAEADEVRGVWNSYNGEVN